MSQNALNRDEWKVMREITRLGGSATRDQLITRSVEMGWHLPVAKALLTMERKGKLVKVWVPGEKWARWTRVPAGQRRPKRFGNINKP